MQEMVLSKQTMARRLKDLRAAKGKTIAEVSDETGIGETALRNYECGLRVPRYVAMFKLADYFGTTVDEIFFEPAGHI